MEYIAADLMQLCFALNKLMCYYQSRIILLMTDIQERVPSIYETKAVFYIIIIILEYHWGNV